MKEKVNLSLSTSFVTTVLISLNLISLYGIFQYMGRAPIIYNMIYIIGFMVVVWIINYYWIVKKEEFLKYNFKKDKKGGYIIISIMIFTLLTVILVGNINRQKIFKEREDTQPSELKKESLEGKIRKWFEE